MESQCAIFRPGFEPVLIISNLQANRNINRNNRGTVENFFKAHQRPSMIIGQLYKWYENLF